MDSNRTEAYSHFLEKDDRIKNLQEQLDELKNNPIAEEVKIQETAIMLRKTLLNHLLHALEQISKLTRQLLLGWNLLQLIFLLRVYLTLKDIGLSYNFRLEDHSVAMIILM